MNFEEIVAKEIAARTEFPVEDPVEPTPDPVVEPVADPAEPVADPVAEPCVCVCLCIEDIKPITIKIHESRKNTTKTILDLPTLKFIALIFNELQIIL